MKNLLLLLALTSFIFYSCEKEEVETDKEKKETTNGDENEDDNGETDENSDSLTVTYGSGVTDYNSNTYATIIIGNQEWMAENLKVTHYADGSPIPHVTVDSLWVALPDNNTDNARAYCWYNNDKATYKNLYGALYTYAAATNGDNSGNNVQGVCPTGWRLPNDADWNELVDAVGGVDSAGVILKATSGWYDWEDNPSNGTDDIGFSALPGGYRFIAFSYLDPFYSEGFSGSWWSATEGGDTHARHRYMDGDNAEVFNSNVIKSSGFSVRCVRDLP